MDTARAGDYVRRNTRANYFLDIMNEHISRIEQGVSGMQMAVAGENQDVSMAE